MSPLDGRQPIGDVAYDALAKYCEAFESYRVPAYAGNESEAIHQMRVNARRIRACMRAFAPILSQPILELEAELRWIAIGLGEVRDVDVFVDAHPDLQTVFAELRVTRLEQLRRDFDSQRYSNLVEALRHRIVVRAHDDGVLAATPVVVVGPDIAGKAFRSVHRAAASADTNCEVTAIHTLRKRAKRLRYTVDCFADLYGKPAKRFIQGLKGLQDILGEHQDAVVAQGLLSEMHGHDADDTLDAHAKEAAERAIGLRSRLPESIVGLLSRWEPFKERMARERRTLWKSDTAAPVS